MKKSSIVIGALVVVALVVIGMAYFGLIDLSRFGLNLNLNGGGEEPPNAEYCGYTDMQILEMLELIVGKDLNNQQGLTFVDALNMHACGQDDLDYDDVLNHYKIEYVDWYILGQQEYSGSGWDADSIAWGNDPSSPTSMKMVVSGSGLAVEELYGYDTMTITSSGTWAGYQAFVVWILAS